MDSERRTGRGSWEEQPDGQMREVAIVENSWWEDLQEWRLTGKKIHKHTPLKISRGGGIPRTAFVKGREEEKNSTARNHSQDGNQRWNIGLGNVIS